MCDDVFLQVAACQGSEGDATPFTDVKVDDVSEELHKRGYQKYGWEVMPSTQPPDSFVQECFPVCAAS